MRFHFVPLGVLLIIFKPYSADAVQTCETSPRLICNVAHDAMATESLEGNMARLRTCICGMTKSTGECDRLLRAEGSAIRLSNTAADHLHHVTHEATRQGSHLTDFGIQFDPILAKLTASMAFAKIFTGIRSRVGVLRDAIRLHTDAANHDAGATDDALIHHAAAGLVDEMEEVLHWTAGVCEKQFQPSNTADSRELRDVLICAFRLERDSLYDEREELSRVPVYERWPGCACGREGKGRTVTWEGNGGVHEFCADAVAHDLDCVFSNNPIDARVPARLARFGEDMDGELIGWTLDRVAVKSCSLIRLETGPNVRTLSPGGALQLSDVSDHARATACDVDRFDLRDNHGNHQSVIISENDRMPYFEALRQYLAFAPETRGLDFHAARQKIRLAAGGIDHFYRDLAVKLAHERPAGLSDEQWFQLRIGVLLRNGLVDADFLVYEPLTNDAHRDHFHIEAQALASDTEAILQPLLQSQQRSADSGPCKDHSVSSTEPRR